MGVVATVMFIACPHEFAGKGKPIPVISNRATDWQIPIVCLVKCSCLSSDHPLSYPAKRGCLDAKVGCQMVEGNGIEYFGMDVNHILVALFGGFEKETFRVGHQLMKGIFCNISPESFPLV